MKFDINATSEEESNLILRAIWSSFRKEYGSCSFQFTSIKIPKDGHLVYHIGNFSTNVEGIGGKIFLICKKKGVISSIVFEDVNESYKENIESLLTNCKNYKNMLTNHNYGYHLESLIGGFNYYKGKNFELVPLTEKEFLFSIKIKAFDEVDYNVIAMEKLNKIMDLLAVYSHSVISYSENDDPLKIENEKKEIFSQDYEWLEFQEIPRFNDLILLPEQAKIFIDNIIKNEINNEIMNGLGLFHSALKFFYLKYHTHIGIDGETQLRINIGDVGKLGLNLAELINIHFCSCLEVISLINSKEFKRCETCSQIQFSIGKRVNKLVENLMGECVAKIVKDSYGERSSYLHEGLLYSSNNYTGISIPQLDSKRKNGFKLQHPFYDDIGLKDFCSYIIRRFVENNIE